MITKIKKLIIAWLWIVALSGVIWSPTTEAFKFWDMVAVPWIGVYWTDDYQEDSLIHTVRKAINRVLWILSFICLCLVLYAWFLMLTSWWDSKKYDQWFTIIKNAWIWLAIIAVSWLIVSLIFYVIHWSVQTN